VRDALRNVPLALYFSAAFAFLDRAFTVLGIQSEGLGYAFLGLAALLAVVGFVQAVLRLRSWYTNLVAERDRLRVDLRQTGQELKRSEAECRGLRERVSEADEERATLRAENDGLIAELSDLITPSGGTAAHPLLKTEELSETHIKNRTVHIADFAREVADLRWGDTVIEGRTFEDCYILGPAILVPLNTGDLTGHVFVGDDQWYEQDSTFWSASSVTDYYAGVIGLENCVFRNCRYKRVGILVPEEEIRRAKKPNADEAGG